MTVTTPKDDLHHALRAARDALLWKLDGLSEHDARRPLTPTGTNLPGLVKHTASVASIYFGETFGRPSNEPLPWLDEGAEPDADMWAAAAGESREHILALHHRAWAHADATIDALPLDAPGRVPHWPGARGEVAAPDPGAHGRRDEPARGPRRSRPGADRRLRRTAGRQPQPGRRRRAVAAAPSRRAGAGRPGRLTARGRSARPPTPPPAAVAPRTPG